MAIFQFGRWYSNFPLKTECTLKEPARSYSRMLVQILDEILNETIVIYFKYIFKFSSRPVFQLITHRCDITGIEQSNLEEVLHCNYQWENVLNSIFLG